MKRIITGLVLITVGGYVLINGALPLLLFLMLIGSLAFYEIRSITDLKSNLTMVANIGFYLATMAYIYLFDVQFNKPYVILMGIFMAIYLLEYVKKSLLFRTQPFLNNLKYFSYVFFGFSSIYLIRESQNGLLMIGVFFLSIWATDVFAYYGGRTFGKTPLSSVSPKKTVEGTVSGVLAAGLIIFGLCKAYDLSYIFVFAAFIIGLMGQLGDLYESLIKRTHNVKDSSNLLPGHGGILDRADSSLFVAPIVYAMVLLFS